MVGEEDAIRRARLVLSLRQDGIMDRRLLSAVERTDRTRYCPEAFAGRAYEDRQIPIDCGQTMEPARRVAIMLSALEVGERHHVLEIGTGSGYATALLARSARRVVSLDRYRTLVEGARVALKKDGITNAEIVLGDGQNGKLRLLRLGCFGGLRSGAGRADRRTCTRRQADRPHRRRGKRRANAGSFHPRRGRADRERAAGAGLRGSSRVRHCARALRLPQD